MTGRINYHYLYCREMSLDQSTGELRYHTASPDIPVAQFIGPKPLSEKCNSFSFEIVNAGMKSLIAIGLCHRRYPSNRQPGWNTNSIGYHADDGGIYHEDGLPKTLCGRVPVGGVMGCSVDFDKNVVTFTKNGKTVFTFWPLKIPPGGFYPIIGLHSHGECVCLLENRPWRPDVEVDLHLREERKRYHSLFCREVAIAQDSGHVRYNSMSPEISVGQFVSECPLSPMYRKFSVEIASQGQKGCIAVGICHRRYPAHRQPGWYPNSIAYHADDGGIFHSNGRPCARGPRARVGDTMACEFDFATNKVMFYRNDTLVFQSPTLRVPQGGFHAALGFHSHGEEVCLLETEPWRSAAEDSFQPPPVEQKYHFSKCSIASLNQASGVLSYVGSSDNVAQLMSKCPLTPEHDRFSVEIVHQGKKCCIAMGLCPQHYPDNNQPGWKKYSIAYHADNGGMYANSGSAETMLPIAREGDVITCQFNFSDKTVSFFIKGQKVYQSSPLTIPPGSFYAAVGLHSEFESVRLCDVGAWRAEESAPCVEPGVKPSGQSMPMCSICMDRAVTKFLIPCGHTFCGECIEEWLHVQETCPTCRVGNIEAKPLFFG